MTTKNRTNIQAYFFMSINDGQIDVNLCGDTDVLSAAFAQLIISKRKEEASIKKIIVDAIGISASTLRDTIITKKGNILPKKSKKL